MKFTTSRLMAKLPRVAYVASRHAQGAFFVFFLFSCFIPPIACVSCGESERRWVGVWAETGPKQGIQTEIAARAGRASAGREGRLTGGDGRS